MESPNCWPNYSNLSGFRLQTVSPVIPAAPNFPQLFPLPRCHFLLGIFRILFMPVLLRSQLRIWREFIRRTYCHSASDHHGFLLSGIATLNFQSFYLSHTLFSVPSGQRDCIVFAWVLQPRVAWDSPQRTHFILSWVKCFSVSAYFWSLSSDFKQVVFFFF